MLCVVMCGKIILELVWQSDDVMMMMMMMFLRRKEHVQAYVLNIPMATNTL